MAADKRGQIKVFGRKYSNMPEYMIVMIVMIVMMVMIVMIVMIAMIVIVIP